MPIAKNSDVDREQNEKKAGIVPSLSPNPRQTQVPVCPIKSDLKRAEEAATVVVPSAPGGLRGTHHGHHPPWAAPPEGTLASR